MLGGSRQFSPRDTCNQVETILRDEGVHERAICPVFFGGYDCPEPPSRVQASFLPPTEDADFKWFDDESDFIPTCLDQS